MLGGGPHRQGGIRRQGHSARQLASRRRQCAGDLSIDISLRRSLQRRRRIGGEDQRSGGGGDGAVGVYADVLAGREQTSQRRHRQQRDQAVIVQHRMVGRRKRGLL